MAEVGNGVGFFGGFGGGGAGTTGEGRHPRGGGGWGRQVERENPGGGAEGHGNGKEEGRRAVKKENEAGGDDRGGRGDKKIVGARWGVGRRGARADTGATKSWSGWGGCRAVGVAVAVNLGRWGVWVDDRGGR